MDPARRGDRDGVNPMTPLRSSGARPRRKCTRGSAGSFPAPRFSHPWLLVLALAPTGCGRPASAPSHRTPGPDVILVSIDSLRFDQLGCYGYSKPTSPTIDGLARAGVRCDTALSTTSWTLPAHAAMLTGLRDSTHGLVDNGLRLAEGVRTLAEAFRDAGWRTAGFFGGP